MSRSTPTLKYKIRDGRDVKVSAKKRGLLTVITVSGKNLTDSEKESYAERYAERDC